MIITATEFKCNLGKYLEMVSTEDVYVTKNGKMIAKLSNPQIKAVDSIKGVLKGMPEDLDRDQIKGERLTEYESDDRH